MFVQNRNFKTETTQKETLRHNMLKIHSRIVLQFPKTTQIFPSMVFKDEEYGNERDVAFWEKTGCISLEINYLVNATLPDRKVTIEMIT